MAKKAQLSAEDWVRAAFVALTRGGLKAVRAEALARDLKVSKGSFYWHFKDVANLHADMLMHWRERATQGVVALVEEGGGAPSIRLRRLVAVVTDGRSDPYGGVAVEAAIRDWARYDLRVAHQLQAVDTARHGYLVLLFTAAGAKPDVAGQLAAQLYAALIGLEMLSLSEIGVLATDLEALLEMQLSLL